MEWPTIDGYELEVDLTTVGRFEAEAVLELSGIGKDRVNLLLNRSLKVEHAAVGQVTVEVDHLRRLPSDYFGEGVVLVVHLPSVPSDGKVSLRMRYSGKAAHGRKGSDWRGILFVDSDETRMCEQTIFYPLVPLSLEGPAVARAPFTMTAVAPKEWELFVPAPGGISESGEETRTWSFRSERPQHLSLLGGLRERSFSDVGGSRIVTLLRAEHADLAADFVREASGAIQDFTRRFGPVESSVIGIVEISCRDSSYNWASDGVLVFDRGALSGSVPARKVAHEVAHLWWGQAVTASGEGERFLTEGLAEYSAWTHFVDAGRASEVARSIVSAREDVFKLTRKGESRALSEVAFGLKHYQTLAYAKGPLVLQTLRSQLPAGQLDAALRRLVADGSGHEVTLEDFRAALREETGRTELRVPWIDASGDVEISLDEVVGDGGTVRATIGARRFPTGAEIALAGAPVAIQLGGRGWQERHLVLLEGERTTVQMEHGDRPLAYVWLDPEGGWTMPVRC